MGCLFLLGALSLVYGMVLGEGCLRSRLGGQATFCGEACEKEECLTLTHQLEKVLLKLEMKEKELMRLWVVAAGSAFSSRTESFKAIFTHRFMELKLAVTRTRLVLTPRRY